MTLLNNSFAFEFFLCVKKNYQKNAKYFTFFINFRTANEFFAMTEIRDCLKAYAMCLE